MAVEADTVALTWAPAPCSLSLSSTVAWARELGMAALALQSSHGPTSRQQFPPPAPPIRYPPPGIVSWSLRRPKFREISNEIRPRKMSPNFEKNSEILACPYPPFPHARLAGHASARGGGGLLQIAPFLRSVFVEAGGPLGHWGFFCEHWTLFVFVENGQKCGTPYILASRHLQSSKCFSKPCLTALTTNRKRKRSLSSIMTYTQLQMILWCNRTRRVL